MLSYFQSYPSAKYLAILSQENQGAKFGHRRFNKHTAKSGSKHVEVEINILSFESKDAALTCLIIDMLYLMSE